VYFFPRGNASDIEVMVGNINRSRDSPSELVGVKRIFVHENYNLDGRANDVALLQVWLLLIINLYPANVEYMVSC
jgi:hypothetical protein